MSSFFLLKWGVQILCIFNQTPRSDSANLEPSETLMFCPQVVIVPIMDIDNVVVGGAGKDSEPVDFNRDW